MSKKVKLGAMYAGCAVMTAIFGASITLVTNTVISDMKTDAAASGTYEASAEQEQTTIYVIPTETQNESSKSDESSSSFSEDTTEVSGNKQNNTEHENEQQVTAAQSLTSSNLSKLTTEDEITLEDGKYVVVIEKGDAVYYINRGDTLSYISSVTGISVDELAEYNHIQNVNVIYAESALKVPVEIPTEN